MRTVTLAGFLAFAVAPLWAQAPSGDLGAPQAEMAALRERMRARNEGAPQGGRSLTPGEIALAQTIFGDGIDYEKVRVVGRCAPDTPMLRCPPAVRGNEIQVARWFYEPDYSAGDNGESRRDTFIHELTHIYQNQRMGGFATFVYGFLDSVIEDFARMADSKADKYYYVLDRSKALLDYGIEQQASIITDYFRLLHGRAPGELRGLKPEVAASAPEALLPVYREFLSDFLRDPQGHVGRYFDRRSRVAPGPPIWPRG